MANHNGHNGHDRKAKKGIYERYEGGRVRAYGIHATKGDRREEQKRKTFKKKDYGLYLGD